MQRCMFCEQATGFLLLVLLSSMSSQKTKQQTKWDGLQNTLFNVLSGAFDRMPSFSPSPASPTTMPKRKLLMEVQFVLQPRFQYFVSTAFTLTYLSTLAAALCSPLHRAETCLWCTASGQLPSQTSTIVLVALSQQFAEVSLPNQLFFFASTATFYHRGYNIGRFLL